jgi:hypothetical protein
MVMQWTGGSGDGPGDGSADGSAGGPTRHGLGMRMLSIVLATLWAALAAAVLVSYHPGGPFDLVVRIAIFAPLPVAVASVVRPPALRDPRGVAAAAWIGLLSALLLMPLLAAVLDTLGNAAGATEGQSLFPSAEFAYAGLVALGTTCLYAALGLVTAAPRSVTGLRAARRTVGLAAALTAVVTGTLGLPALANDLALRNQVPRLSRFGPTDATLPLPQCSATPAIGATALLDGLGSATVDGSEVERASLSGSRMIDGESWSAERSGSLGGVAIAYRQQGPVAQVRVGDGDWASVGRGGLGLAGPNGLSVDGPIVGTINGPGGPRVEEDRGIELFEGARARHCRSAIDGRAALNASVLVRLLATGSVEAGGGLTAWRGTLDWWVFADGELGQATITIGGYPGDAWPGGGLQGEITARVTATERSAP